jgi:type I restriction enzyme, S subunit
MSQTGLVEHQDPRELLDELAAIEAEIAEEVEALRDLLSRSNGIVRLRNEAKKKAAELIPALFLDMFGDPATNPRGMPIETLGQHVDIPSVVRTPNINTDANYPCIGADSIESHTGKLISLPSVSDVQPKSGKYWFEPGDVLYSKIRPYLAKASLAPCAGYCSADMYPLRCRLALQADFLLGLLLTRAFTDFATAESVRAQMPKLNRETLFAFRFPVPPVGLQLRYAEIVASIRSIQIQQDMATATAQKNMDALMAKLFG